MSAISNKLTILKSQINLDVEIDPMSKKIYLELEPPSLLNNQADVDRLTKIISEHFEPVTIPLALMNKISRVLRDADWRVTATLARFGTGWRLIEIEPGNTTKRHLGLAVDLGTTTVVCYLVDMGTGAVLATAAGFNGQVLHGDDILTRIFRAGEDQGLDKMQAAIVNTLNTLISNLAQEYQMNAWEIGAVVLGANTTMVHLLLGLDPARICREPYIPVVNIPGSVEAAQIGLQVNPHAPLYCLPGVGSYVGGDVIGGVLASDMYNQPELALFVDIGTNGEIVIGNRDWLVSCAGAAGPALEGGVAIHGMRAEPGAVFQVRIDADTGQVSYLTIGGEKAKGLCGSGLVDCLAELLMAGIINRAGKFKGNQQEFIVVPAADSATGKNITFTQVDIDNILRTKGAVNAAVEELLEGVGADMSQIETFYAAGAFGQYLDLESAITIGLYPDLPRERMIRLGNSSGEGARLVLLSEKHRKKAEEIARSITYFELNASATFMNKFVGSKFLPHTNLDYYPTVRDKMIQRGLLQT